MNTSLLVMSCDSYSDCWQPFIKLKRKYWKCPYPMYFCTETKNVPFVKTLKTKGVWTSRLKQALEQIETEYVILMLEDFFIRKPVDQTRIDTILKSIDKDTAVYNLERCYSIPKNKTPLNGFIERENKEPYLNSCQPSIHNRKKLIERLQKEQTAWEWELTTVDSKDKFYINIEDLIIDIGYYEHRKPWGVMQGKWTEECKEFFKKENIEVDYSLKKNVTKCHDLSIIIPYYNTLEDTKKLMDRLIPQLNDKVEVILIDDGCNEKELDKYPIKVIHQSNGGVSKARNTGLDNASGKYIAFVDSDDMIPVNYVDKILNKINQSEFDYCFMSWKYKNGRDMIIKDKPPLGNNSVWNCIYKKETIGSVRFPEHLQIGEEIEFNLKTRVGKKENITDVMYIYNSGRQDSLSTSFNQGKISEYRQVKQLKYEKIIYRSFLSKLGGVETAIFNACKELHDKDDVTFLYEEADEQQLKRLRKYVRCVKFNKQKLECNHFIYYGINPQEVENYVESKVYHQQICNDFKAYSSGFKISPKTNLITADSEASAKSFMEVFPKRECKVLYNLFGTPENKRVLNLLSATRLSWEKGYPRMKALAKRMHEKGILFEWTVFTNDLPDEEIDGFIFRKPRLNVADYMWNKDYIIQLSDMESWGCTVSEGLIRNVPAIVTNWASAKEQITHGKNGYILNMNMSNIDDVIDKMYSNKLEFKHKQKGGIEQWQKVLGKGKKSKYVYNEKEIVEEVKPFVLEEFIALKRMKDDTGNFVKQGEEPKLHSTERIRRLIEHGIIKRKEV